ncbi:MAG: hypothetical protein ACK4QP_06170 [Pseudorhizobium sp.]
MQGNKTHQQQRNIIEKRVDTSNAGEEFDARADLTAATRPAMPTVTATI